MELKKVKNTAAKVAYKNTVVWQTDNCHAGQYCDKYCD